MGTVYQARDLQLGRMVAVKVIMLVISYRFLNKGKEYKGENYQC
jgi:hypothetical protein